MPLIIQYLLKLSLSLSLVCLFYHLLLRKLTFYTCNRFYLLGYTALCFIIPLINITPALEANSWQDRQITSIIPAWQIRSATNEVCEPVIAVGSYWNLLLYGLISGSAILLIMFSFRYLSFLRIRRQAKLLADGETNIYQVDKNIMPFSFGNAIFINHTLHSEDELREIIRHEFVHVRQKHSIDILWAELLCMINWYNPFIWMLRKSIRQNLEFIADEQVVKSGLDKKQYQYMLLKVIGNNHFSIANQFNFSSLKKRIAMMNKDQTSKRQLLRLLLLVPAVAILLLAFRQKSLINDTIPAKPQPASAMNVAPVIADMSAPGVAVEDTSPLNKKGYTILVTDSKTNSTVVVKDRDEKIVKKILLTEWNKNKAYYGELYGEVPPPPPLPRTPGGEPMPAADAAPLAPPVPDMKGVDAAPLAPPVPDMNAIPPAPAGVPAPPLPPAPVKAPKLPANVTSIQINNNQATVILKDNKKEKYDLNDAQQKAAFGKKYGTIPEPPEPPAAPVIVSEASFTSSLRQSPEAESFVKRHARVARLVWGQVENVNPTGAKLGLALEQSAAFKKGDVFLQIWLKNGNWDMYNLGNKADVEKFRKNYGENPPASPFPGC